MANLSLFRFNRGPDLPSKVAGTFGRWVLPSGRELFSVERAWVGNKPFHSCIPDGVYTLRKRVSDVVRRSSGGLFTEGWEVTDVPGRTFIMIHPGNWPHDFEGCLGTGTVYGLFADGFGTVRLGVGHSLAAFKILMAELEGEDSHSLTILPDLIEYP